MADVKVRDSGNTLRTVTRIRMRDAGNVLRTITRIRVRDSSNVLRTVYGAGGGGFAVSIAPSPSLASRTGAGSLTSGTHTGTVSGGVGPFTYAWTYVSGSSFTINSPSSITTTFATTLSAGADLSGVYRLTATDTGNGGATTSATVTVELAASAAYSVSVSPNPSYTSRSGFGTITSAVHTATVTGGVGPFTYAHTYVSGVSFTINSPTAANTTFTKTAVGAGVDLIGVYRLTVTDTGNGGATTSYDHTVELEAL